MEVTSFLPCCPGAHFHPTGVSVRSLSLIQRQQEPPNLTTTCGTSFWRTARSPSDEGSPEAPTRGALPHPSSAQAKPRRSLVFRGTFLVSLWWHSRGLLRCREQARGPGGKATRGAAELRAQGRRATWGPAASKARPACPHLPSPALTALSRPVNPSAELAHVADWPRNEPSPLLKASQTPSSFGAEVT